MARRRSFMATRMSKMRGLDRSEKEILVQIGQIVDITVNNRTPTNPQGAIQKANKKDPRLPSVSNLDAKSGVRSVKLTWSPVDGSILEHYDIIITNMDTGVTTKKSSYTSSFVFKGESGNYKAEVKPIGRNGVAAPTKTIFFNIADSVMILEGAKNSTITLNPVVSETVQTPADYVVFAWTAFTLNNFSAPTQNSPPIVQLLYGGSLNTATLIQSIEMFPESETVTNLEDLEYGGIIRADFPFNPTREGNFETSHTVMFAPFNIPDAIAGKSTKFWVRVTNRDIEDDVVSLSIVLWVGSGGRGELGVTPIVSSVNPRSIDFDGVTEVAAAIYDQDSGEMEDSFSVSMWIKPLDLDLDLGDPTQAFFVLNPTTGGFLSNNINIIYIRGGSDFFLNYSLSNRLLFGTTTITFSVKAPVSAGTSTIFTNGENQWNLLTATWDRSLAGAARLNLYMNGVLFVTGGSLTIVNGATAAGDIERDLTTPPFPAFFTDYDVGNALGTFSYPPPRARYNMMGLWSSALTSTEIVALYNSGLGGLIDWRLNAGGYTSASSLIHYWLFGFNTASNTTILEDYGNSSFALINLSDNAVDITVGDDVVTDTPPV